MLHVVTGGSGSGKSEYAEKLIAESALHRRIYVATMMVWTMRAGNVSDGTGKCAAGRDL